MCSQSNNIYASLQFTMVESQAPRTRGCALANFSTTRTSNLNQHYEATVYLSPLFQLTVLRNSTRGKRLLRMLLTGSELYSPIALRFALGMDRQWLAVRVVPNSWSVANPQPDAIAGQRSSATWCAQMYRCNLDGYYCARCVTNNMSNA